MWFFICGFVPQKKAVTWTSTGKHKKGNSLWFVPRTCVLIWLLILNWGFEPWKSTVPYAGKCTKYNQQHLVMANLACICCGIISCYKGTTSLIVTNLFFLNRAIPAVITLELCPLYVNYFINMLSVLPLQGHVGQSMYCECYVLSAMKHFYYNIFCFLIVFFQGTMCMLISFTLAKRNRS